MENKGGNEKGPAKKRLSYRRLILNSDSDKQTKSSKEGTCEVEGISKGRRIMENLKENCPGVAPLLPPLASYQSEDEPECITLSSDEEMEEEECHWRENVADLVLVKMETGGEDENEMDIGNKNGEAEQVKKKKKKRPKRGKSNDGPVIVSEYSLQEKNETDNLQTICKYCEKKMKTKKSLAEHMRKQHKSLRGPSVFKCETCGKETKSKHLLENHLLVHTTEHPFECILCERKFKGQMYLDKHLKSNKHKNAKITQHIMENEITVENEEGLSPPPPLLLPESSVKEVSRKSDASTSTSPEVKASLCSDKILKSTFIGSPTSTFFTPKIQSSIYASPIPAEDSVVSSTMTNSLHNNPVPVLFYGYMIQPNGASYSSTYPLMTPPVQYHSPSYSGMTSQQTMQQMSYQRHAYNSISYSQPLFTCLECKARFSVEAHFRSHMRNAHSNDCWKCPNCEEVMSSPGKFEQHFSQCV